MQTEIITVIGIVFASNGLWEVIRHIVDRKDRRRTAVEEGLLAVLHDRLYQACAKYIGKGYITVNQLENLKYMHKSYKGLKGNGTLDVLYKNVCKLKITAKESEGK